MSEERFDRGKHNRGERGNRAYGNPDVRYASQAGSLLGRTIAKVVSKNVFNDWDKIPEKYRTCIPPKYYTIQRIRVTSAHLEQVDNGRTEFIVLNNDPNLSFPLGELNVDRDTFDVVKSHSERIRKGSDNAPKWYGNCNLALNVCKVLNDDTRRTAKTIAEDMMKIVEVTNNMDNANEAFREHEVHEYED